MDSDGAKVFYTRTQTWPPWRRSGSAFHSLGRIGPHSHERPSVDHHPGQGETPEWTSASLRCDQAAITTCFYVGSSQTVYYCRLVRRSVPVHIKMHMYVFPQTRFFGSRAAVSGRLLQSTSEDFWAGHTTCSTSLASGNLKLTPAGRVSGGLRGACCFPCHQLIQCPSFGCCIVCSLSPLCASTNSMHAGAPAVGTGATSLLTVGRCQRWDLDLSGSEPHAAGTR
jgi:hypothetical protein